MNLNFFNFYKRYKWTADDFTAYQDGHSNQLRTSMKGTFVGATLFGMDITPNAGLTLDVAAGISVSPTGYLMVKEVVSQISVTAPTGNPKRSLIVARPKLVLANNITKPTSPFETVALNTTQDCEYKVIEGTESATPDYPAKLADDIILAGIRLAVGQVTVLSTDIDYNIRDYFNKTSGVGQRVFISDDRLRPFKSAYNLLGIKPSQRSTRGPTCFIYPGKGTPSIFPKSSGVFNNADSFLNFISGAITGGDVDSPDFTPTIPTAGNSIVATVCLNTNDTINVLYGTQGTRLQCLNAIQNQIADGSAGSINAAALSYKIAYVVVNSLSGSLMDIEFFDARSLGGGGGSGSGVQVNWVEDSNAPTPGFSNGIRFYDYETALGQILYGSFKVPESYSQGAQIKLKLEIFANTTINAALIQSISTLIRANTDAITSTTNQRTSTNAAQSFGSPANKPIAIELDLTDAAGKINNVAVSSNDTIGIQLTRGSAGGSETSLVTSVLALQSEIKIG